MQWQRRRLVRCCYLQLVLVDTRPASQRGIKSQAIRPLVVNGGGRPTLNGRPIDEEELVALGLQRALAHLRLETTNRSKWTQNCVYVYWT